MHVHMKSNEAVYPRLAEIIETARGREARCPEHGHLLGVFNEAGQFIIKCGHDEYVIVEVSKA